MRDLGRCVLHFASISQSDDESVDIHNTFQELHQVTGIRDIGTHNIHLPLNGRPGGKKGMS